MQTICAIAALFLLAACSSGAHASQELRLGMVTDVGGLGDHSYNDEAFRGLLDARTHLGAHITVLEPKTVGDFQPMIGFLAGKGFDETFGLSYNVREDLAETARRFPSRHFSIIDATIDEPNVTSVTFKEEEGSFLAGALAAMVSRTNRLGFLGGIDVALIRKFEAGFAAGAHEIDPRIAIDVKFVGDFNDVPTAAELAGIMYNAGADVVYTAAGRAGIGAINQVKRRRGVYLIGVNVDQDSLAPGKILTSVLKRVDVGVFRIAQLAARHQSRPAHVVLGLREGGIDLTRFRYARKVVTPAMIARLGRIKAAIIAGKIVVPATREAAAAFIPSGD